MNTATVATAGKDITAAFESQSPQTLAFLKVVPVVGTYTS